MFSSLTEMSKSAGRVSLSDAVKIANDLMRKFQGKVARVAVAGSIRRKKGSVGDIDLVVIGSPGAVKEIANTNSEQVWGGDKRINFVYKGRQVNVIMTTAQGWGAAMLYATGSGEFNMVMRLKAKRMGFKLNEYGLWDVETNKRITGRTEHAIFRAMGYKGAPNPEDREVFKMRAAKVPKHSNMKDDYKPDTAALAKQSGFEMEEVERRWQKAVDITKKQLKSKYDPRYAMAVLMKMLKIKGGR